eukprot:5130598-Alexandrium_andersonii.AAC.1
MSYLDQPECEMSTPCGTEWQITAISVEVKTTSSGADRAGGKDFRPQQGLPVVHRGGRTLE